MPAEGLLPINTSETLTRAQHENLMMSLGKIVTIRTLDSPSLLSARNLVLIAVLGLAISSDLSWAFESCHIHPPGRDLLESEFPRMPLYSSLDECESANAKYFGGTGRCHCFPDFSPRDQADIWPQPKRDWEFPPVDPRP